MRTGWIDGDGNEFENLKEGWYRCLRADRQQMTEQFTQAMR
jgi:hypothetical protein